MLRSTDRFMTGLLLMAGASFLLLCLTTFFFDVGELEMRIREGWYDRKHWYDPSMAGRTVDLQGNRITIPRDVDRFTAPIIQPDGTLDQAHVLQWDEERGNFSQAHLLTFKRPDPFNPADFPASFREPLDYRSSRTWHLSRRWVGEIHWMCSPRLGIVRIDKEGRFEGSLTDEGWVPGRLAPSTFNHAVFWTPEQTRWRRSGFGYGISHERTLVYTTVEGVYVADLYQNRIRRVASMNGSSFSYLVDETEGRESIYLLQAGRILQVSLADASLVRDAKVPETVPEDRRMSVAFGSDDRLIFRWRVSEEEPRRYGVAVLDSKGDLEAEYSYAFVVKEALQEVPVPARHFAHHRYSSDDVLEQTVGGRLSTAFYPPAWHAVGPLVPDGAAEALKDAVEIDFDNAEYDRTVWFFLLLHAPLVVPLFRRARRHARGWLSPLLWSLSVLVVGLPALVTYAFLGRTYPLTSCAECRRELSAGFDPCPSCGRAAPRPEALGIEILRPAR